MATEAHPPAAHPPAPAGGGGKGPDVGKLWGIAILVLLLVMFNVLGMLSGQLNSFLQVLKFNAGPFFFAAAAFFIYQGMKK